MKKFTILFALAFCANTIFGQGIIDKYYTNLEEKEDATSVFVSAAMFEMAAKFEIDTDDKEFNDIQKFIKTVKSFSLIKVPGLDNTKELYKDGINKMSNTHEELVRVKDDGNNISVYIDESNDVIYELAVVGIVDGEFLAASLIGEMDLNLISEFINNVQSESFDGLSALKNVGVSDMKVYPNPSAKGTDITIEVPANMVGGMANIYDMDGGLVKTINANNSDLIVSTLGFPSGGFLVELTKDGITMKQKMIVLD